MTAERNLMTAFKNTSPVYVEDVFSTYVYAGNGSSQTITNSIDLSTKGGLVWFKYRDGTFGNGHYLYDTARGAGKALQSNQMYAETAVDSRFTSFNTSGFTINTTGGSAINATNYNYVSWTFRKQPKFVDIVNYTGDGQTQRDISHNLQATPGFIIVKCTSASTNWATTHYTIPSILHLNTNESGTTAYNSSLGMVHHAFNTTTSFRVAELNGSVTDVNASGQTYVAYLFAASNSGGFGSSGTDSIVACGSYLGNGSTTGPIVTLGWEPQFVMIKASSTAGDWFMSDVIRGQGVSGSSSQTLLANTSGAEVFSNFIAISSTGFQLTASVSDLNGSGQDYVYVAIRRPIKPPTSGLRVMTVSTSTGLGIMNTNTGIVDDDVSSINDLIILRAYRNATTSPSWVFASRLVGIGQSSTKYVNSSAPDAETTTTLVNCGTSNYLNFSGATFPALSYIMRRASGFLDIVCYNGNGGAMQTLSHSLAAVPQMIIYKSRSNPVSWYVYHTGIGISNYVIFNSSAAASSFSLLNNVTPTSTQFTTAASGDTSNNGGGYTYISYLFATCAGVSKVGSYTGTGTTLQVNCGFSAGARFILIKRTDVSGDWYVWDSVRGIAAGNDPYLLMNSSAVEVTNTDYVNAYSAGFEITSSAPAAINGNGGTFIYLAIA